MWKGAVYVGTLDGRLVKLDARTGKPIWDINTIDRSRPYTITGAPRIVKGMVLIGNGGAEYGVRGYLTAYDADTGRQIWRFYVVPGDPKLPPEDKAMADAMKTWIAPAARRHKWWEQGGGGTPWDSMAYDPDLDLIYIGTGNGASWNRNLRSPGGGDNLYLSSIVALQPANGRDRLVLPDHARRRLGLHRDPAHHTRRPHDRRRAAQGADAGAEERLLLCDRPHQRKTDLGQALHDDHMGQGRRHEDRPADRKSRRALLARISRCRFPGPIGAHNWQPMAFDPQTGLVYIPVIDGSFIYAQQKRPRLHARRVERRATSRSSARSMLGAESMKGIRRRPPRASSAPGILSHRRWCGRCR